MAENSLTITSNIPGVCSSSKLFLGSTNIGTSGLPPPTASNSIANLLLENVSLVWMWSRIMSTWVEFSVCNMCGTTSEWSRVQNPRSWKAKELGLTRVLRITNMWRESRIIRPSSTYTIYIYNYIDKIVRHSTYLIILSNFYKEINDTIFINVNMFTITRSSNRMKIIYKHNVYTRAEIFGRYKVPNKSCPWLYIARLNSRWIESQSSFIHARLNYFHMHFTI